jgi:hypothetical protein
MISNDVFAEFLGLGTASDSNLTEALARL